jgi:ribonucleoside-diphosphate reductase alpha chain
VNIAVRFLDQVVDRVEIDDYDMALRTKQLRRIGLGVTGLADCLEIAGIAYNSTEGLNYAERLASTIANAAATESKVLAKELGPYLPGATRRNISVTCCQPTGNITLLLGTRGFAIEPFMEEATVISWKDHLKMQAVWQKYFENAVAKTVNLPSSTTVEDILRVFVDAYESKILKGIAVYRNSSRDKQPMQLDRNSCNGPNGTCNI